MPATEARPARRPCSAPWTTTYSTAGPGISRRARAVTPKTHTVLESGKTTGSILARAAVPRHDVRLPDERSRQRADQGHARGARAGGVELARRRRRPGLQHLHDP